MVFSFLSLCCFAPHMGSVYNLQQEFSVFVVTHLIPAERHEEGLVSSSHYLRLAYFLLSFLLF